MKEDRDFVTALARGIRVLRCFTAEHPELGTTQIAGLVGLPQSTVWRLCYTLQRMGLLVPGSEADKLRAGPGVLTLGQASVASAGIAELAYRPMKEIADRFSVAVSLAAPSGTEMVVVQRAEAPTILRLALNVGSTLSMATSALGWAYLAGVSPEERRRVSARLAKALGDAWPEAERKIEEARQHYATHGFVVNLRHYHPDVNAIGVPVTAPGRRLAMALNSGGAVSMATVEKLRGPIAEELKALAAQLSALLPPD
ncbi:MAG TPA: helix-turn-helix domain-containing protein [Crenalkalicoccus sp.]|jgi:DNA-binding IclR family transcriptional regulator|nr:helix-turn-helix domain-containing protein [Crenalkalicoccus sp.]